MGFEVIFLNKKGISPVVATALLLVVAVVAVIGFSSWFGNYQSGIFSQTELKSQSSVSSTTVETVVGDKLYFRTNVENLSIRKVTLDGNDCNFVGNISSGVENISLASCIGNVSSLTPEVVIVTDEAVYSKKVFLKDIQVSNQVAQVLSITGFNSSFAQWIGHSNIDYVTTIVLDGSNNIYVGGWAVGEITDDGLAAFSGTFSGSSEGFILKFDSSGNSLWSKWIGGTNMDYVETLTVDSSGNIFVGGTSREPPTDDGLVGFNGVHSVSGGWEGFVLKFDSSGNSLWGQWLGEGSGGSIYSMDIDSSDNLYVTGYGSGNFTDDGLINFNGNFSGGDEIYLLKFDSSGNSLWGQWLGGSNSERPNVVLVDNSNNVYVGGYGNSDFTDDNLNVFAGSYTGGWEGFVSKFDSSGNHLWGQWFGDSVNDEVKDLAVDSLDNIYVGGYVRSEMTDDGSLNFQGVYSGNAEGFISKFDSSGNSLISRWFGSSGYEFLTNIAIDDSNNVYVGGTGDGPITDDGLVSFEGNYSGSGSEGFVSKFDSSLNNGWNHWFGTSFYVEVAGIDFDSSNNVYVVGSSEDEIVDDNLTTFQGVHSGGVDWEGFILKFDPILE